MTLEVELKARAADLGALRARLEAAGARLALGRTFEDNLLLDDPSARLRGLGQALRVRLLGERALLTWKGRRRAGEPSSAAEAGLKVREEIETACDDGAALLEVLARLGLEPVFRYEKYRETWEMGGVHVLLDETPAGDFVEIEGDADAVRRVQAELGIADGSRVEESYPSLFRRLLLERGEPASAMVFRDGDRSGDPGSRLQS